MHTHTRLQLLANPSLRWFVISSLLTAFGAGVSYLALSWGILRVNNTVAAVAILMLCFWLPNVFFGPWLGVFADKYSRKWLIIGANGLRGVVLIVFGLLFYHILSAHLIYGLMICLGLCFSLYLPAQIALIREVVSSKDLLYANSIMNIAFELGFAAGIGAAGFIVAAFSMPASIVLTGVAFVISTLAMLRVKLTKVTTTTRSASETIYQDFKLGMHYLYQNKKLIIIYSVQLLLLVAFMTTPILLAPFAKNILHATAGEFGGIEASLSFGIVFGGLFAPWVAERVGLYRCCLALCFLLIIFFIWFAFNRIIVIAQFIYFCLGIGLSVWPMIVTKAQHLTNLDFQARVQSVFNSLSGVIILAVYLLVDIGSHFIAIDWLYVFEVIIAILAALILWRYKILLKDTAEEKATTS
jgi:MFS family permease